MVLDFFRGSGDTLSQVEETLVQMMRDGRDVYDTAMEAVFGGGKSKEAKQTVRSTDREINEGQRAVRRALVIRASVSGGVELPLMLTYMSVVKDVERVGDYAKNIYDLAKYGIDFSTGDDVAELARYRDAVGQLISDAADVFENRDTTRANELVAKADVFLDEYDAHVKAAVQSTGPASDAVGRALFHRYLKRITAHLMNLMTSLTMPIDQLDYYDEAREDR